MNPEALNLSGIPSLWKVPGVNANEGAGRLGHCDAADSLDGVDRHSREAYYVHMHIRGCMPRPRKQRICRQYEGDRVFKPRSIPMSQLDTLRLEVDELEAMRVCDLEGLDKSRLGSG